MALTDWVFPEMGYTCEQDKRALYEKKIAPVYSGVTDNRRRVAEGNFCHILVLPVKISGKRKGDKDDEFFAPALKRMIPILDREYKQAEEQYLEAKRRKDAIHEMFAAELLMERKKKDPCYKCAYNRNSP